MSTAKWDAFLGVQTKGAKFPRDHKQNSHCLPALDKPLELSGLGVLASNYVILDFALAGGRKMAKFLSILHTLEHWKASWLLPYHH